MDYSLYFVTGRELLPAGKDYFESLEDSLKGGHITIVQVREKGVDTAEFLEIAQKTQEICKRYSVPLLINDRIDIALAIGADGVHLGQTDMPVAVARKLLPAGSIIGVSCNTADHARQAVIDGAQYIGIGPVWSTLTKKDTSPVVGVRGVGRILTELEGTDVKAVAIGGIKSTNLLRTLHGSVSMNGRALNGVAVVSDIAASSDPQSSAQNLSNILSTFLISPPPVFSAHIAIPQTIKQSVALLLSRIKELTPLVHQITNNVVINQSANATLALGASPIMATAPAEMEDLSKVIGSLLVNFGTIGDKQGMIEAGRWANVNRKPIVFDPVAIGATNHRRTVGYELLNAWQATVIKGNAAEIGALANSDEARSRGVDSVGSGFRDPAKVVRDLARTERCIIVLTGVTDWISDGHLVVRLSNGHPLLSNITGSGCMVGTCVATFCAAASLAAKEAGDAEHNRLVNGDMFLAAIGGVSALNVAGELAAVRDDVHGPGTFLPALIDELYKLTPDILMERVHIEVVQ